MTNPQDIECYLPNHKIVWVGDRYECEKCRLIFKSVHHLEQETVKVRIELLDEVTKRWNNYIGDMPDKEKQKLTYLEMTGMLWGIVAQFRIPLEDLLKASTEATKDKE